MTRNIEQELRSHLGRRADAVQVRPAPLDVLRAEIERDRHRRGALTSLVAVCAVIVIVGTWAAVLPGRTRTSEARPTTWTVDTVPTAGDLAQDTAWTRQAIIRLKSFTGTPAVNHVVFAGRLPVGAAIVVAQDGPGTVHRTVTVLYSRTGRTVDLEQREYFQADRSSRTVRAVGPRSVAVAVDGKDERRYFVVVPLSSVRTVEVSAGPRIEADGTVHRSWREVTVHRGAAVGQLDDVEVNLPQSRVGTGTEPFSFSQAVATEKERKAVARDLMRDWTGSWDAPSEEIAVLALDAPLAVVRRSDFTLDPLLSLDQGRPGTEILAVALRLDEDRAFETFGVVRRDATSTTREVFGRGRALRNHDLGTTPFVWIDELLPAHRSSVDVRVRAVRTGAARFEVRDTESDGCLSGKVLGGGVPDAYGLVTINVTVPLTCRRSVTEPLWGQTVDFGRLSVVAYDERGREIGTSPIENTAGTLMASKGLDLDQWYPSSG